MNAINTLPQRLGACLQEVRTWNPARQAPDSEISYIDLGAVDNDEKVISAAQRITGGNSPSRARQLVHAGDILISTVRPYLNGVARVPDELDGATASTGFCVLRPDPDRADASFLFHWVRSPTFIADMIQKSTGASYPAVSDKIIHDSLVPLPSLPEQKRVGAILNKADELRRRQASATVRLKSLSRSLFADVFAEAIRNTASYAPLGDLCDVRDGTHDSPKYVEDGFPLLTSKNFSKGRLELSGARKISRADFDLINRRSKVDRGDIVMPMIGTIGSPVVIGDEPTFAIKNVALIKMAGSSLTSDYVKEILDGPIFQRHASDKGRGGTQKFVSLGDIRGFLVPRPSSESLRRHRAILLKISAARKIYESKESVFNVLFASLQHRAFRGEL